MNIKKAAIFTFLAMMALPLMGRAQAASTVNGQPAASTSGAPLAATAEMSNQSTIIFFREGHMNGAALKPSVYLDGKELDRLANGRWLSVHTEPGKHNVQSSAKNEPATVIDIKEGETIYVQMVIVNGTWRGAGRLMQVDGTDAQKAIGQLKPLHD